MYISAKISLDISRSFTRFSVPSGDIPCSVVVGVIGSLFLPKGSGDDCVCVGTAVR